MSINLINKNTIVALEKRLLQLLDTDNKIEKYILSSALSISRLTLDFLNIQKKFKDSATDLFGEFTKYDSQELLINISSEISRLANVQLINEHILKNNFFKTNAKFSEIDSVLNTHNNRILTIENHIFPPDLHSSACGVIASAYNIKNNINDDYDASINDFIICNNLNKDITITCNKSDYCDILVIANIDQNDCSVKFQDYLITPSSIVTLMSYDSQWYQIPNISNCYWEFVDPDNYVVTVKNSIALIINKDTTITLPLNPVIDTPQFITFINIKNSLIKIKSDSYNILNLNIDEFFELDEQSLTLMFIGNKWIISTDISNFEFVTTNYIVNRNNMILLVDQKDCILPYEITLPKNPSNLYSVTISDIRGDFSKHPCRILTYHNITTELADATPDKHLDLDIDFISITLQFISDRWIIKT